MIRSLVAALCLCVMAPGAWSQPAGNGQPGAGATSKSVGESRPVWSALTPTQQAALTPLRSQWPTLDADRKAKWLVVAQRFPSMPAADRERMQARMAEWAAMSPLERGRARQSFQELRTLPPADRHALWEAYQALPEDQRRDLAQRAKTSAKSAARPAEAPSAPDGKRRVAVNQPSAPVKPVSPTVMQARPGATTTLVTKAPAPPLHHQPGLPKITASKGFVDPATLLPNRGPQGAATHAAAAASEAERPVP